MESGEKHEDTVKRVRSLLKLASKKGCGEHESPKERARKETEFFKKLFMQCDTNGSGTLSREDVLKMARKYLKIAERLVSDEQLMDFFAAIDTDGGGEIDFTEFLSFIRAKEDHSRLNEIMLKQVKRAVRLAIRRKRMTLQELEYRFYNSAAEGIIDTVNSDGSLGPEEMRRFFRKVLGVNVHEAPDKNLAVAFKAMDEDGGGTLDAGEFMDFIRAAIKEETTLCPSPQRQEGELRVKGLLCGMRGALPDRVPRARPGSGIGGSLPLPVGGCSTHCTSAVPFCLNGRELEPRTRLAVRTPSLLQQESKIRPLLRGTLGTPAAPLLFQATLPRSPLGSVPSSPSMTTSLSRTGGGTFLTTEPPKSEALPLQHGSLSTIAPRASSLPQLPSPCSASGMRGTYAGVKGALEVEDARVLNRIEERLFNAGVDVRGWYHKHD